MKIFRSPIRSGQRALVKLASLSSADRKRGVITMSPAIMRSSSLSFVAPGHSGSDCDAGDDTFVKTRQRSHGAEVVLYGNRWRKRARCEEIQEQRPCSFTLTIDRSSLGRARSLVEDRPDLDVLVFPIGGGGLIAGNAVAGRAKIQRRWCGSCALSVGMERAAWRQSAAGGPISPKALPSRMSAS
jgi:threonine dehydratase